MRTTTVVWYFDPNDVERAKDRASNSVRLKDAAVELAGELYREPLRIELSADNTLLTVTRGWPDLATAEAWVALVQHESETSLNNNLVSAQVDPE